MFRLYLPYRIQGRFIVINFFFFSPWRAWTVALRNVVAARYKEIECEFHLEVLIRISFSVYIFFSQQLLIYTSGL